MSIFVLRLRFCGRFIFINHYLFMLKALKWFACACERTINMDKDIKDIKEITEYVTPKTGKKMYQVSIYVGKDDKGKSILKRKKKLTKEQALKFYYDVKLQIVNGTFQNEEPKRMKFQALYEKWLKFYTDKVEESTLATTKRIFDNHILPELKDFYVDKITVLQCNELAVLWKSQAPKTFLRYIRYTSNVLQYGVSLQVIPSNPMSKIVRPSIERKPDDESQKDSDGVYSKEELEIFLNACKQELPLKQFTFFRVLAYSGMRKEEIYALTWSNVDFENEVISVKKALKSGVKNKKYVKAPKTKHGTRDIPIDSQTMKILKKWRIEQAKELFKLGINAEANKEQLVFQNRNNSFLSPDKPRQWNLKVCNKYNLKYITIRGFRHTYASMLANAGVLPKQAQLFLGHAKFETTMNIYTQGTKDMEKIAFNKFNEYMSN